MDKSNGVRDDHWLVAIGVSAVFVDRAENRFGIIAVDECAWAIVDRFARNRRVVRVHDTVHKTQVHPFCDQSCLCIAHTAEELQIAVLPLRNFGEMTLDRIVGKFTHLVRLAARGEELEGAYTQMRGGDARQHHA